MLEHYVLGTLINLMLLTTALRDHDVGCYTLYGSNTINELTPTTKSMIGFVPYNSEFGIVAEVAREENLEELADLQLVQDVVVYALKNKPSASPDDLVKSLIYYLNNDAFLHFD